MAYEFLNETTYTNDLSQQEEILNILTSRAQNFDTNDSFVDLDSDLVEILAANEDDPGNMEDQQEGQISQASDDEMIDVDTENFDDTDMELLGFLFNEQIPNQEGAGSLRDAQSVVNLQNIPMGLEWLRKKSSNVKFQNLNSNISKYLNTLPENIRGALVATSGNDQSHVEGSKHYSDNAIDLRFNKQAYDFISKDPVLQRLGLRVLDPNHGTAPHIHLESKQYGGNTKSYNPYLALNDIDFQNWYKNNTLEGKNNIQYSDKLDYDYYSYFRNNETRGSIKDHFPDTYKRPNHSTFSDESIYSTPENRGGRWINNKFYSPSKKRYGGTLYAEDERTQRIGLNNPNYNSAVLDLVGKNKIRGLDNYQPVAVTDGSKYEVLHGPQDTATFNGKVYEKRL